MVRYVKSTLLHCEIFSHISGQIWIWDLTTPQKPYSPGTRSRNLEDITSLSWNRQVSHILATSSSSGYTVVWDLKNRREVVALASPQSGGQLGGPQVSQAWMGSPQSIRRGVSTVAWHPEVVSVWHNSFCVCNEHLRANRLQN